MLKAKIWVIKVLPTLAPSITASAGANPIPPARGKRRRHQPGRGAALQHRRHGEPGQKGIEARASSGARQSAAEPETQLSAETPLDAGADHVRAPEQEPDIAGKLQKGDGARHSCPTFRQMAIGTGSRRSERFCPAAITRFW
jgi:hypothetical protein